MIFKGVKRDAAAELEALGRSQAVIYFKPDGTILDANPNFLNAIGYPERPEIFRILR